MHRRHYASSRLKLLIQLALLPFAIIRILVLVVWLIFSVERKAATLRCVHFAICEVVTLWNVIIE